MRDRFFLILCGFIILFYLFPLARGGIFQTHDGENHMARIAAFSEALRDGQFPVRWAGNLNYSYGSPVFIFFYSLPYALAFLFHTLGFGIVTSFKLVLFLSFILSFFSFFLFIQFFVKKEVAFIASLLYVIAPYHLLNLYVRGDVGELLAYVFIPLIFASIEGFRRNPDLLYLISGTIAFGLSILSHNGMSLLFSPLVLLYILFFVPRIKNKFIALFMIPGGLLLSGFFWMPALLESKYTNAQLFIGDFYKNNFIPLIETVHSRWGFGASINSSEGLAPQIGILYFILVIVSFIIVFFPNKNSKYYLFWGGTFLLGIFLATTFTSFMWEKVLLLKLFQFPWRMIVLSTFASVVLAGFVLNYLRSKKILMLFSLLFVLSTISFIATRENSNKEDAYYYSFPGTTYYHGEASTVWSAGDASAFSENPVEVIEGDGRILDVQKKSNLHTFALIAQSDVNILDRTYYFPGWKLYADGVEYDIQFQDPEYRGLVTARIPKGEYLVEVKFENTKMRAISNIISASAFVLIGVMIIKRKYINSVIS